MSTLKRVTAALAVAGILIASTGCVALIAGAAGGVGTAVWLSGKLRQDVEKNYDATVRAAEKGLREVGLKVERRVSSAHVVQFKSEYNGGKPVWVDVSRLSATLTRVEVRAGFLPDEGFAQKIMKAITRHL